MTFEELHKKISKRWWLPCLIAIVVGFSTQLYFPKVEQFESSITITISTIYEKEFVSQALFPNVDKQLIDIDPEVWEKINPENANRDYTYFRMLGSINGFITNRFSQLDIQSIIASEIGQEQINLSNNSPFYQIINNSLGSTTFYYKNQDQEKVKKFSPAIKDVFEKIVKEWNQGKDVFSIMIVEGELDPSITTLKPSIQEQILPFFTGFIAGLAIIVLLPLSKNNKFI